MLLKLPITLSSNSFYFDLLFPSKKHPIATKLSLIYKAMLKLQYILPIKEVHTKSETKSVVFSISKGYLQ